VLGPVAAIIGWSEFRDWQADQRLEATVILAATLAGIGLLLGPRVGPARLYGAGLLIIAFVVGSWLTIDVALNMVGVDS